jgi:hypothetical protein
MRPVLRYTNMSIDLQNLPRMGYRCALRMCVLYSRICFFALLPQRAAHGGAGVQLLQSHWIDALLLARGETQPMPQPATQRFTQASYITPRGMSCSDGLHPSPTFLAHLFLPSCHHHSCEHPFPPSNHNPYRANRVYPRARVHSAPQASLPRDPASGMEMRSHRSSVNHTVTPERQAVRTRKTSLCDASP